MTASTIGGRPLTRRGAIAILAGAVTAPMCARSAGTEAATLALEDHGGGPQVPDNSEALRLALAELHARGGGVLQMQAGTYRFASAALGYGGIELPSGVTVQGRGKQATQLVVTGDSECYFFLNERSGNNQAIRDLTARGNGVARRAGPGGFYYCSVLQERAADGVSNCTFENVRLENFGGDYWIRFYCSHPVHRIVRCGLLSGCEAHSESGNARNPDTIAVASFIVEFRADGGIIEDCFVRGLSADLDFVKGGIAAFGSVRGLRIESPDLRNAFQAYRRPNCGAYAILLYDSTGIVTDTIISNPVIARPFSCGIYAAGSKMTQIISPRIFGQSDADDTSIPKAAIALNGANAVRIVEPDLHDNRVDIDIAGISSADYDPNMTIQIQGGSGRNALECGVRLKPSSFARLCGGIHLLGYSSVTTRPGASAMLWKIPHDRAPAGITDVVWDGGECSGGPGGYDADLNHGSGASHPSGDVHFRNMRFGGAGVRASFRSAGFEGGAVTLTNVRFEGRADLHIDVADSAELSLDQISFDAPAASGVHTNIVRTHASIGTMRSTVGGRILADPGR